MNPSTWGPAGALTNETALSVLAQGQNYITAAVTSCTIDLAKITSIDSAGVAVLLEWQRYANLQQKKILFIHPPAKLISMVRLSELEDLLHFH